MRNGYAGSDILSHVLSQTAEYALRAVVCLAQNGGRPLTTDVLAEMTGVPRGYLAKVMRLLARTGVASSQRGLHGGFTLAHAPETLTVLDVVDVVDPLQRISTCPLGARGHGTDLCPLHQALSRLTDSVEKTLAATTIADLVPDPTRATPLCDLTAGLTAT